MFREHVGIIFDFDLKCVEIVIILESSMLQNNLRTFTKVFDDIAKLHIGAVQNV